MTKQPANYAADSADQASAPGPQFDDVIGAIQFAYGGADVPVANGDPINNIEYSIGNTDHFVGIGDFFATADSANTSGDSFNYSAIEDSANASGDVIQSTSNIRLSRARPIFLTSRDLTRI